jgi:hypothetical protein
MKILARIVSDEIEVEIDTADLLTEMLYQFNEDTKQSISCSISTMHGILAKIPDKMIREFSESNRESVYRGLQEQANRWKLETGGEGKG